MGFSSHDQFHRLLLSQTLQGFAHFENERFMAPIGINLFFELKATTKHGPDQLVLHLNYLE